MLLPTQQFSHQLSISPGLSSCNAVALVTVRFMPSLVMESQNMLGPASPNRSTVLRRQLQIDVYVCWSALKALVIHQSGIGLPQAVHTNDSLSLIDCMLYDASLVY